MPVITRNTQIDDQGVASKVIELQTAALLNQTTVATVANAAGVTLTAAQVAGGLILRSGAVAVSDTTPTAAGIIAAISGATTGDVSYLTIRNDNTGILTLVAGTGVTLEGTTTIAAANARVYAVRVTGAAAVTISGLFTAAV